MASGEIDRAVEGQRRLYSESLSEHGTASKAVGWKDEASQLLRFDVLSRVITDDTDAFTVADWGCGYGAMFGYLDTRFGPKLTGYSGCDISSEMVDAARAGTADPRARFEVGSTVESSDYTFVSGTFNVRFEASDNAWRSWIEERVRDVWNAAERGIAFNLLSSYVDWREPHLYYADPCHFFDFCKRELSRSVTLFHDYPLYEWTIAVTR